MSESKELIVKFKRGISEDIARAAVKGAGATVRRRMRTDEPAEVMLLVKIEGAIEAIENKLKAYPSVHSTEENDAGFSVR